MKSKVLAASFFVMLLLLKANSAWAAVQMNPITVPAAMTAPLDGFTINYSITGSKSGVGAATANLSFYISASANGSTGVATLYSSQMILSGYGWGPYYPPSGTQSKYISRYNLQAATVTLLENITAACAPQTWYILGQVDGSTLRYAPTVLGTIKQADFVFTGGTMSPSVIKPGGTTNISFDLFTRCPASSASTVGIFLTDANYQLLSFIGGVTIGAGAGTSSLSPTPITFSPFIATGTYHIVLVADVDGVIAESNESNNSGDFALNISSAALAAKSIGSGKLIPAAKLPVDVASQMYEPDFAESDDFILQGL